MKTKHTHNLLAVATYSALALFGAVALANAAGIKPNIVYIVADDLGWKDVGFNGCTDIKTPNIDKLAEVLGRYLQVMATVIQNEKGTIDKYIGDAVMAFWNAPEPVGNHSNLACRAALKCRSELRALYDSPAWKGVPPFETRFGLHRCLASVGHFGAPDRFNYTAIGDGINLTSRLEALNNRYGTAIITSESIYSSAKERFEFRLLDRVAVKGKVQEIAIYELLAERMQDSPRPPYILHYEEAFDAYQRKDFQTALALLDAELQDQPSRVLADRCRYLIQHPPPPDWNGTYLFASK